ncbi:hypothetical protein VTK73DRAFT_1821 [Phialemonium thermophilum]|uniref:Uncharacterized protein n=1 Tax=Phialemonium thermophilum TaxID=223376 RepID=A0ABR3VSX3_9PEZI
MVRRAIFCGLAVLQAATAVLVPSGLSDGLYSIPFDANGTALGEPVPLASALSRFSRVRRQNAPAFPSNAPTKCGNGGRININDFSTAKANLETECDAGVTYPQRTAVVFITGGAVAYFCNYDASGRCWRQEVEDAMNRVVQSCGSGNGGEVYLQSYQRSYGGDNLGQQICRF